ncbi:UDP-4-amino-4,6-dideoxy-N-acetyl-beta-L-altrosamine transaminase [Alteromonas facilis]|uniref:UDP-4-amino-4, 6-dideoxy-N-acetyl-beta-L-altrosamine transaminase n=1 Tax=Alteromonas facilis TaxID=2048004 RepID=UPI000C289FD0|nr:UDP-4-amino-4,6-dideoxy-N-acetyl-beta-L-altrosamine transaminase [Alteromonas facilis]
MIPYGKHNVIQQDIDAVVDVLTNKFLTQGETVPRFEQALCDFTGAKYSVAVNSGTSGLHVACLAAGVGKGDVVWTSPNSFVASANCALYCGASVDFIDIDPVTRNISLDALSAKLKWAEASTCLPKAIVVVHFAGLSCDMRAIKALVEPFNILLIEDAAHALGGYFEQTAIGACQYSDMAVLSFHPVKSITTAEGGAVMTNDSALAERLVLYAKHGITRDETAMTENHGPWYYEQQVLGFNYRMSDIHAALGLSQLSRLSEFINQRRALAHRYHQRLRVLPLQLPPIYSLEDDESAWHLYMVEVLGGERDVVFSKLRASGIGVNVHYIPIHLQPFYQSLGFKVGQFPNAEAYYSRAITLPLYPGLSESEQDKVVDALREALS